MYPMADPHYQRMVVQERHGALRRAAGMSRIRRELRHARRRERAGPRH